MNARASGQGAGYLDPQTMGCQFSIYPLRQDDLGPAVRDAIAAAQAEGSSARVGNLSTLVTGSEDQVFRALRAAYRAAQRHGPTVMVATFAAGMPSDGLVAAIQNDIATRAGAPGQDTPDLGEPAQR